MSGRRGTLKRGTLRGGNAARRPPALFPRKAIVAMSPCKLEESDVAREVARKLAPEFVGFFSLETIERSAAEGYAYYSAMVESGEAMANYLPILTERFVRNRLHFVRTDRLVFAHPPVCFSSVSATPGGARSPRPCSGITRRAGLGPGLPALLPLRRSSPKW